MFLAGVLLGMALLSVLKGREDKKLSEESKTRIISCCIREIRDTVVPDYPEVEFILGHLESFVLGDQSINPGELFEELVRRYPVVRVRVPKVSRATGLYDVRPTVKVGEVNNPSDF